MDIQILMFLFLLTVSHVPSVTGLRFVPEAFQSESFGSPTGHENGVAITLDKVGNVYIAGTTTSIAAGQFGEMIMSVALRETDPADLETFEASDHLDPERTSEGLLEGGSDRKNDRRSNKGEEYGAPNKNPDIFIAKFTPRGETIWVRRIGSEQTESVTSIAYRHGIVYIAGKTTGALDKKDTPEGTSDLFAAAFNEDGSAAWSTPLQIGSGGNDSIEAIALDEGMEHGTTACPYIYIAGRVGGDLFQPALEMTKDESECGCHRHKDTEDEAGSGTSVRAEKFPESSEGRDFVFNVSSGSTDKSRLGLDNEDTSDMFVAKVAIDGSIVQAIQIPLSRNNSADAIAAIGGKIYVAVNSFGNNRLDPAGASSLLVLCAEDLSYRPVFPDSSFAHAGDHMYSMAVDSSGNIFLGGVTVHEIGPSIRNVMGDGDFIVRKYDTVKKQFVWETQIGRGRNLSRPKISLRVGKLTNNIYAAGHGRGFFTESQFHSNSNGNSSNDGIPRAMVADDGPIASNRKGLLRTGLTILSSSEGNEVITWDKYIRVPSEYEDIQGIALDKAENLLYTGRRLNAEDWKWDACLGSFGSKEFSAQSRAVSQLQSSVDPSDRQNVTRQGSSALVIGLICMAASISVMVTVAAFVMTRTWALSRRLVMAPDGGYFYEDTGLLSKFEETSRRAFTESDDYGNGIKQGAATPSIYRSGDLLSRRPTREKENSFPEATNGKGGSAEPA